MSYRKKTSFLGDARRVKATFHLTISMRGQRATGKIQRNNYHHGSWGPSLKPGLHIVVTIAEHACDHVLKRVLKLLGLVSITRQMLRPRHINKAI